MIDTDRAPTTSTTSGSVNDSTGKGSTICSVIMLFPFLFAGPALILTAVILYDLDYKDCSDSLINETDYTNVTATSPITSTYTDTDLPLMTSQDPSETSTAEKDINFLSMTSLGTTQSDAADQDTNDFMSMTSPAGNSTNATDDCELKLTGELIMFQFQQRAKTRFANNYITVQPF